MRGLSITIAWLICSVGCTFFPAGERSRIPAREMETRLGRVQYELVNWGNRPQLAATLTAVLKTGARFRDIRPGVGGRDWAVQIILERYPGNKEMGAAAGERPVRFFLKLAGNTLSGNSGLLFPLINRRERRITFIVRRRGEFKKKYIYHSDTWTVFGWASLILWPASRSKSLRYDMARIARLFVGDAVRDGLLFDTTGGGDE